MDHDPEQIACWQRLGPSVTTSGRLKPDDIAALDDLGVSHVINLALADSPGTLADEAELLAARGIRYTHIPVPFGAPEEVHLAAFREALQSGDGPVHVHCIMNWRVSAFFYRHHKAGGMDEAEARALMEAQWSPERSENADAPAWARFIAREDCMDFAGQHVAITGASTGIGRATATRIVALGGKVTLIARRSDLLEAAKQELGEHAAWAAADVGDQAQLIVALDAAVHQNGPIDGLFLNAAAEGMFALTPDYTDEAFEEVMRVNVHSPFWAVRHALPAMTARGKGSILITGSIGGATGMVGNIGYCVSKHAVTGITRVIAMEAAPAGVRCNCLVPGFIDTPMLAGTPEDFKAAMAMRVPQQRIGRPEEAANVAAFLLSDLASHVTAQSWAVDGGLLGTLKIV